jgi:DNA polymerase-1
VSAHVLVARLIYNDPTIVKDGKDPRYAVGKAINLAIGYGLTAVGLAEQTGLSETEAQKIIDLYFKNFPGVSYYMTKYRNLAYRDGYITTPAGRRIYVNPYDFKSENNAINSPIQGGAADFTKLWAINVWRKSKEMLVPFSLCMLVHDELVFDVQNEYKDVTIKIINYAMQEAAKLYPGIPFTSDLNMGDSWACHE